VRYLSLLSLGLSLCLFSTELSAQSASTLVVSETIPFASSAKVRAKVKQECRLEEKQGKFIRQYGNRVYSNIVSTKPAGGDYHVLEAEITVVHAPGGGAWSGAKWMRVEGTLKDASGKVLGTFDASRYSGGGAFGGYKGTCSIIGRCTKAIGKDIAQWLAAPSMNATLGDGI